MVIKEGVTMQGLHPVMRPVLREAEEVWRAYGRPEGVTVTEVCGGTHSAASWHYFGLAIDLRAKYFDIDTAVRLKEELTLMLEGYDVILHTYPGEGETTNVSHIHVEVNDELARELGVLW